MNYFNQIGVVSEDDFVVVRSYQKDHISVGTLFNIFEIQNPHDSLLLFEKKKIKLSIYYKSKSSNPLNDKQKTKYYVNISYDKNVQKLLKSLLLKDVNKYLQWILQM